MFRVFEGRLKERFAVIAGRLSDGNRYLRFCPTADAERPSENAGGAFQTASDGVRASGAVADGVGQSITDACIGWDTTEEMLALLADAVRNRP